MNLVRRWGAGKRKRRRGEKRGGGPSVAAGLTSVVAVQRRECALKLGYANLSRLLTAKCCK